MPSLRLASRTDTSCLSTRRRNLLNVLTLITPAPRAEKFSRIERQRGSDFNVNASRNGPALEMNQQAIYPHDLSALQHGEMNFSST
jgi:hypothetical protein